MDLDVSIVFLYQRIINSVFLAPALGSVVVFQEGMSKVDRAVSQMEQLQAISRQHAITDWYIIKNSYTYVERCSLLMCVLIVLTSVVQTCTLRRLFRYHKRHVDATKRDDDDHRPLLKVSV